MAVVSGSPLNGAELNSFTNDDTSQTTKNPWDQIESRYVNQAVEQFFAPYLRPEEQAEDVTSYVKTPTTVKVFPSNGRFILTIHSEHRLTSDKSYTLIFVNYHLRCVQKNIDSPVTAAKAMFNSLVADSGNTRSIIQQCVDKKLSLYKSNNRLNMG